MCLLANTSNDKPGHMSKSLICLPMDTPGIILDKRIDKVTSDVYFQIVNNN
jgi:citronellyl-CoA dehydrogenase